MIIYMRYFLEDFSSTNVYLVMSLQIKMVNCMQVVPLSVKCLKTDSTITPLMICESALVVWQSMKVSQVL